MGVISLHVFIYDKNNILGIRIWVSILVCYLFLFCNNFQLTAQDFDAKHIFLADPTVFEEDGVYYLYGTKEDSRIKGKGFLVYTSTDLKNWAGPVGATDGFALKKGTAYGTKGFWAPQVLKRNATYYMAYTANEKIAIATSDSPLGPFTSQLKPLEASVKQIDPFVFFNNGKIYLYHVRLQEGNRIFVAEMNEDLSGIKPETLKECIYAEEPWEDTANADWTVAEGPTVLKKDKLFYLLYSANDFRNPDYAVGYATSNSPLGPWNKSADSPIISSASTGEPGSGHGDLFYNQKGKMHYVLHTHFSKEQVGPRKTGIVKLLFKNDSLKAIKSDLKWLKSK